MIFSKSGKRFVGGRGLAKGVLRYEPKLGVERLAGGAVGCFGGREVAQAVLAGGVAMEFLAGFFLIA